MRSIGTLAAIGLFFTALSAPLLAGLSGVRDDRQGVGENRVLAAAPGWPTSTEELRTLPARIERYVDDHFLFRTRLVDLNNRLRYALFNEVISPQITLGRENYIFLNSHSADDPLSMIRFLCGESSDEAAVDKIALELAAAIARTSSHAASTFMFVPTKSVIYPEYMPAWLQRRCERSRPVVPRILARLEAVAPDRRARVYHPAERMRALKDTVALYPPQNFHWVGPGARAMAAETARTMLGRSQGVTLPVQPSVEPSDLQQFLPGIGLEVASEKVDFAAAGIVACRGGTCLPELGDAAPILADIGRYDRPGRDGPRLLIVSDSFGAGIAGYLSAYFVAVRHVSVANLQHLSPGQKHRVRQVLYDEFSPDQVLYVFHDFAIHYFDTFLKPLK